MDKEELLARLGLQEPAPLVTVLRLHGAIGSMGPMRQGLSLATTAGLIEEAFKPKGLKAVALSINSPGGSPAQSALIAKRIRDLADEKKVPVIAFAEDVAASGGYWLMCAADEVFAQETSIIGSVGVIAAGFGFQDLIARWGIERRVHTQGARKGLLDPFRPEDPDDVVRLKELQGDIFESFKDHVRARRGAKLKAPEDQLFTGDVWTGKRAVELGLVDGIADVRGEMRRRFGDKVKLRLVAERKGRIKKLLGLQSPDPADLVGGALSAIEERAMWGRFGL